MNILSSTPAVLMRACEGVDPVPARCRWNILISVSFRIRPYGPYQNWLGVVFFSKPSNRRCFEEHHFRIKYVYYRGIEPGALPGGKGCPTPRLTHRLTALRGGATTGYDRATLVAAQGWACARAPAPAPGEVDPWVDRSASGEASRETSLGSRSSSRATLPVRRRSWATAASSSRSGSRPEEGCALCGAAAYPCHGIDSLRTCRLAASAWPCSSCSSRCRSRSSSGSRSRSRPRRATSAISASAACRRSSARACILRSSCTSSTAPSPSAAT